MSSVLNFGKYKNKSIEDVYAIDQGYARWLLNQEMLLSDKEDIKAFLSKKFDSNDKSYLLTWGKHKNRTIKWIHEQDKQYFSWLSGNDYVKQNCKKLYAEIEALLKE